MDILWTESLKTLPKNSSVIDETFLEEVLQYILKDEHIKYLPSRIKVSIHISVKRGFRALEREMNREKMWKNFHKYLLNIKDSSYDQQHSTEGGSCRMFRGRRQIGRPLFLNLVSMFKRGQSDEMNCVDYMVHTLVNGNFQTVPKIIDKHVLNRNER